MVQSIKIKNAKPSTRPNSGIINFRIILTSPSVMVRRIF